MNITKASELIRLKLIECGGTANVYFLNGKVYNINIKSDGKNFESKALPKVPYEFSVF